MMILRLSNNAQTLIRRASRHGLYFDKLESYKGALALFYTSTPMEQCTSRRGKNCEITCGDFAIDGGGIWEKKLGPPIVNTCETGPTAIEMSALKAVALPAMTNFSMGICNFARRTSRDEGYALAAAHGNLLYALCTMRTIAIHFDIDEHAASNFMDGYADYLSELMNADSPNRGDNHFFDFLD